MTSSSSATSSQYVFESNDIPFQFHLYQTAHFMDHLPTSKHFLAAGTASAVASGTFNPLDCLRVRWQTQQNTTKEQSIVAFGRRIVRQEGLWQGLWKPAVGVNMVGMAMASGIRFGYYETIRKSLQSRSYEQKHEKQAWQMVVAGLISGASAYYITTPFHLLKTRIQSTAGGHLHSLTLREGVMQILSSGSLSSLFKGSMPLAVRGSFFTAGQMIGYDGLKTMAKKQGHEDGPLLHAVSSIFSAFCASFASAPADYIMARYMSCSENKTLSECVRLIYTEGGLLAFWRGWSVFFIRLTPVLMTYSSVYEQLRFQLGLGYLD